MLLSLTTIRSGLLRGPDRVRALLSDLPESLLHNNEGEGTWSPFQVLGHLLHTENVNWIPRLEIALGRSTDNTFAKLDRDAHLTLYADAGPEQLLDQFAGARARNLSTLDSFGIGPAQLQQQGLHPEFGPVTVEQLLATWSLHDWSHIGQIARTVAKGHTAAVGPWVKYFNILSERTAARA
jgi:hypothetical protein